MFVNQMQVMLYVNDVAKCSKFWQSVGFVEIERQEIDGTLIVEVAPSETADTHLVLYDLAFIQKHSPEVAGNTPSIMFFSEDITSLYKRMKELNVRVGEMVQLPSGLVFNFADPEENYFAVSEKTNI